MLHRRTFRRRSLSALCLAFAACISACDALLVDPDAPPIDLALTLIAASAAGGSAEAFDAVDRIRVRVLAGQEVVEEIDQAFDSEGGDVSVPIRAPASVDGVAITIRVELSRGADMLFTGEGSVTPDAAGTNSAEIVLQPVAADVLIDPPTALFEAFGETLTFRAVAIFATGDTIDGATITFRATTSGILEVQSNGLATARAEGTTGVEASFGGHTAQADAEVRQRVTEIEVARVPTSLAAGASFVIDALLRDANGFQVVGRTVQWTSSDPTILVIDPNNVARAVGSGTVTVTGTIDDATVSFQVVVATIPVTPSGLRATARGTLVSLAWQDNADNETGYQVLSRNAGSGAYAVLTTLPANATSHVVDVFTPDALLEYVVRACNGSSCSADSNTAAVATVPSTPSSTVADYSGSQSFAVSWADTRTETSYVLEWDNDGVGWILQAQNPANVTQVMISFSDDPYVQDKVWRVTACNPAGCSPPSLPFWYGSGTAKPTRPLGWIGVIR